MSKVFRLGFLLSYLLFLTVAASGGSDGDSPGEPVVPNPDDQKMELDLITGIWEIDAAGQEILTIPGGVLAGSLTVTTPGQTTTYPSVREAAESRLRSTVSLSPHRVARFEMIATDNAATAIYHGVCYHRTPAQADSIFLTMARIDDTTAPVLADHLAVTPRGTLDLELNWDLATDGRGNDLRAYYLIWITISGQVPSELPALVAGPGETSYLLTDLLPETSYDLLVRAVDNAGNLSAGTAKQISTPPAGGGLYVDGTNGVDNPAGGGSDNPLKTITYALNRTAGYEPVFIAEGSYTAARGEVFPLVLKDGTQLKGELQWSPIYPLVRIVGGGTTSLIQGTGWNSIFKNLPVGEGVYIYGTDYSRVLNCQMADCSFGVGFEGRKVFLAGCRILACNAGIYSSHCEGEIVILNNSIADCREGIELDDASSVLIKGCSIWDSQHNGIRLQDLLADVRVEFCICQSDGEVGILVDDGQPTLKNNILACNRINLVVQGSGLVDARNNRWRQNPPGIRTFAEGCLPDVPCDILYDLDYSGTAEPLWEPCSTSTGCVSFLLSPFTKKTDSF